ncbi:unnamed protein product [Bursaphelenchus xylophilus]|uniref:Protein LTV1 homolog n=1 Tax=Bursaphelenchus xylophilus TaxID=6326 RepID=A0A1I7RVD1_BURXY|nr:unnamed protein product [Bursaphelenchus xylophilus]CAG9086692.1 unnamed protein product [Bursaphelenchus xylophilus]
MGKKKHFIDKSKAVTFRLETRVTEDRPPILGPQAELTNVVDVTDEELLERERLGIYYADNYNYLSHLKSRDELPELGIPTEKVSLLPQSSSSSKSEIEVVQPGRIESDIDPNIDPELLQAMEELEGQEMMGEEDFDLDDNFLELAGGVDEPEQRKVFEQFRQNNNFGSDSEDGDEEIDSEDADFMDGDGNDGFLAPLPAKPILKKSDKSELDQRFSEFYDNMDKEDDSEDDEEFFEGAEDGLLDDFADEYNERKDKVMYEKPDNESKRLTLEAFEKQEVNPEKTEKIMVPVRQKRAKWDCESIVSTYSNVYNHPTLIQEEPKRKPTDLTRKTIKVKDVEMEDDTRSVRSAVSTSTYRPKDETPEERRLRKQGIKEERRIRRAEKKANKNVFKEERKKMSAQRGQVHVDGRTIA